MAESLHILILEDKPTDAELVQFELQEAGIIFISKVVMTEEDFIRAIQDFSPDIILSDYDLPKYNGALALAEAKRRCPDTPFILVTGAVTEDRAIDILTQGAKDYVLKNRLGQRLVPAVQRALAEAEEHRARKQAEAELRIAHRDLESLVGQKTTELQAVLDTAPVAIWIAHDPECKLITGNAYADEMIMKTSRLGNISRSAALGDAAVIYKVFHDGVELKPEKMPAQVATATGKPVTDMEVELVFPDGRHVHLIESATPLFDSNGHVRGAVITGSDVSNLKQSENAFKHNEERQRLVLQASSMGTFEVDLLTGEGQWNATEFELLGLKPGEVVASPDTFFRFVHPDDVEQLQDQWNEAMRSGKLDAEFRIVRADGQERWLAGKGQFFSDGKPEGNDSGTRREPLRFMGVNFDITERKKAEEAAAAAQRQIQGIIDNSTAIIYVLDLEERFLLVNTALAWLLNSTPERMIGKRRHDFMPKPDADWHEANDRQVIEAGKALEFEEYSQLKGRSITWLTTKVPLRDAQGRIYAVAGISTDVSESKRAEEALRESEGRFRVLTENSSLAFGVSSSDGKFFYINKAYEKLFGLTQEELNHLDASELWRNPEDRRKMIDAVRSKGFLLDYEVELKRKDGTPFWAMLSVNSVDYDGNQAIMASVYDITERRRAEEGLRERTKQLEDANKELESFSYSVSHDLRAPLRAIDGYSRMILKKQGEQLDGETRSRLQMIMDTTKNMGRLIDDLLALSRLGSQAVTKKSLNMEELVSDIWPELLAMHPDRKIALKNGQMPLALGDRSLIWQVYTNLLDNAVKFTHGRECGLIETGAFVQNGEIIYYVRDNGVGFDMKFHDKLFGVFQRLHSQEDYEGTGAGLAIAQMIINRHGGRVWAEGEVDKGATFYFTLPN
jgi:PAS domain S-box-containing protein